MLTRTKRKHLILLPEHECPCGTILESKKACTCEESIYRNRSNKLRNKLLQAYGETKLQKSFTQEKLPWVYLLVLLENKTSRVTSSGTSLVVRSISITRGDGLAKRLTSPAKTPRQQRKDLLNTNQ